MVQENTVFPPPKSSLTVAGCGALLLTDLRKQHTLLVESASSGSRDPRT